MTREEALNTLMKMRAWRAWGKEQKEEERPEMPEQKEVDEAFDVCIKLLQEQLPLSSNLDEAAKKIAYGVCKQLLNGEEKDSIVYYAILAAKAGAKWDAGQGYVDTQAVINEYEDWGDGFAKLELGILKNDDFFEDWKKQNEIIVQIRKKQ